MNNHNLFHNKRAPPQNQQGDLKWFVLVLINKRNLKANYCVDAAGYDPDHALFLTKFGLFW